MIVLDTNIVSVLVTPEHPDLALIETWQRASRDQDFGLTVITQAEIAYGIALLPQSRKRQRLAEAATELFARTAGLILPFGSDQAAAHGVIMADRRSQGRPISSLDAQIAAIARVAGAAVATRNTPDFLGCGIEVINPYDVTLGHVQP